jgi:hypothetical protein
MHDRPGYHVEIAGEPHVFPRRIELLGHGIDSLLLEMEEYKEQEMFRDGKRYKEQKMLRDGKRYFNDGRKLNLPFRYRYVRPHPLILQVLGERPFFGDPNWSLEVIRREDGDLLTARANRIIASTWLAFEVREREPILGAGGVR